MARVSCACDSDWCMPAIIIYRRHEEWRPIRCSHRNAWGNRVRQGLCLWLYWSWIWNCFCKVWRQLLLSPLCMQLYQNTGQSVFFEKLVKQFHENTFLHAKIIFVSWSLRRQLFSWHCFTHFPKTTASQQVIFSVKLSSVIIFKLCKFNVNLWTLCFLSYREYIDPLSTAYKINW